MSGILNVLLAAGDPSNSVSVNAQVALNVESAFSPTNATAYCAFMATGEMENANGTQFMWLLAGDPADVEIYVSGSGDALFSGTLDTWLALSSNRSWVLKTTGNSELDWSGTYTLRQISTGVVLGSNTLHLIAIREP